MIQQAIGLIETRGMAALVEATDAALKEATLEQLAREKVSVPSTSNTPS